MEEMQPPQVQDRFTLKSGYASFVYPTTLNADDISDLKEWLALVVKKLDRCHGPEQNK